MTYVGQFYRGLIPQDIDEGSGQGPSGYQGPPEAPAREKKQLVNLAVECACRSGAEKFNLLEKSMEKTGAIERLLGKTPANPNSCAH